jgi:hypothetical protein
LRQSVRFHRLSPVVVEHPIVGKLDGLKRPPVLDTFKNRPPTAATRKHDVALVTAITAKF